MKHKWPTMDVKIICQGMMKIGKDENEISIYGL